MREGATKADLMQHFCLNEEQYERVVLCVERIRSEQEQKQKKEEGR